MRKIIILSALFLAACPVTADHHREHALQTRWSAEATMRSLETKIAAYRDDPTRSEDEHLAAVSMLYRIGIMRDKNASVANILLDPLSDLDDARRIINQPVYSDPDTAIMKYIFGLHALWGTVSDSDDPIEVEIESLLGALGFAFDRTLWHINDGIREEKYADPEFICSGPNNHCE